MLAGNVVDPDKKGPQMDTAESLPGVVADPAKNKNTLALI